MVYYLTLSFTLPHKHNLSIYLSMALQPFVGTLTAFLVS
jgi:hypothetical protein